MTSAKSCSMLPAAALLVLAVSLTGCGEQRSEAGSSPRVAAPDMTLRYLDGTTGTLSDLEGKVVLLNFWATWCPPCRVEIPHFQALHKAYEDADLVVVGVSMDRAGADHVARFSDEIGITYPVAVESFEKMEQIWGALDAVPTIQGFGEGTPEPAGGSVQMMPTTFVIDRDGSIFRKHVGPRSREQLEPELRMLMGMAPAAVSKS